MPGQLKSTIYVPSNSRKECDGTKRKKCGCWFKDNARNNTKESPSVFICHARLMPMGQWENGFITRLTVRRMITRSNQKNMAITAVPTRIMSSRFVFSSVPGKRQSNSSLIVAQSRSSAEVLKEFPCLRTKMLGVQHVASQRRQKCVKGKVYVGHFSTQHKSLHWNSRWIDPKAVHNTGQ